MNSNLDDKLALAIAEKIEGDPSLLRIARENMDRWISRGTVPFSAPLEQWKNLVQTAFTHETALRNLLHLLRSDDDEARRMRDFSPFAGILSPEERREIIRQCDYSHSTI